MSCDRSVSHIRHVLIHSFYGNILHVVTKGLTPYYTDDDEEGSNMLNISRNERFISRFANEQIFYRTHVWGGGGGVFNIKHASQHLP